MANSIMNVVSRIADSNGKAIVVTGSAIALVGMINPIYTEPFTGSGYLFSAPIEEVGFYLILIAASLTLAMTGKVKFATFTGVGALLFATLKLYLTYKALGPANEAFARQEPIYSKVLDGASLSYGWVVIFSGIVIVIYGGLVGWLNGTSAKPTT